MKLTAPNFRSVISAAPVLASVAVALTTALGCGAVQADDRPFLRTTRAVVEDDDERVFEFTATHVTAKKQRSTSVQLEYSFSPTLSVELELGHQRDRIEGISEREQGLGLRMSWVDPAREGWGLATKFGVERERESGDEWAQPQWSGVMAFSMPVADKSVWVHANVGARYNPQTSGAARWTGLWSLGAEKPLNRRASLFAEVAGASDGRDRIAQVGLRQWLKREKVAVDVGVGRQFANDIRGNFLAVSLSLYDLSY
jgi:hypothetical protein